MSSVLLVKNVAVLVLRGLFVAVATCMVITAITYGLLYLGSAPADIMALIAALTILFTLMGGALVAHSVFARIDDFLGGYLLIIGGTIGLVWLGAAFP